MQHLDGLISNTREVMSGVTPEIAYHKGMSMSLALRTRKNDVKLMLLAELERLTRHVNATRSFQTQADLHDAVDDICELFPSLKVEEVLTAFKHIRQGRYQLYGNFTTNTLLDCLRKYDMENTVTMREEEHRHTKRIETGALDVKRLIGDLNRDGKLKTSRKLLDRTFIPYPNDTTDAKSTEQHKQQSKEKKKTTAQSARDTESKA